MLHFKNYLGMACRPCAPIPPQLGHPSLSVDKRLRSQGTRKLRAISTAERHASVEQRELLTDWLTSRGVELSKGAIEISPAGLIASRAVSKGETLCSIPDSAWLTPGIALSAPVIGEALKGLENWLVVALYLLHEKHQGLDSAWAGYISSLPSTCHSPVMWKESELELLAGSQLAASVEAYKNYFSDKFTSLQNGVFKQFPSLFEWLSFEEFLWAVCTVRARVYAPLEGDNLAIVPLGDLTQHRRNANCKWELKSAGLFRTGGRMLALTAQRPLAVGESVSVDLGSEGRTDGQLLLDHGALDLSMRTPSFALTIALPEDDPFYDDKADILEINGEPLGREHILRGDLPPSETMLATLRLLNLGGADAFLLESIFRNETWGHMQLPVSEENEKMVYRVLIDGCKAALMGYSTSIDEDLALLSDADTLAPGTRGHAAVWVRLAEKEALDGTLRFFEERIDRLGGMEYYAERRLKNLGLMDDSGNSTWDGFFKDSIA